MNRDLDYFTEFLENPSAPTLGEFFRMLFEWIQYVKEHKDDFNYMEDDEWKEIRERLNEEFAIREEEKDSIDAEWENIGKQFEGTDKFTDDQRLDVMTRQQKLIKKYPDYFNATEEDIARGEEKLAKFIDSKKKNEIFQEKYRITKQILENSIAALDDYFMQVEENTGRKPQMFSYKGKKWIRGN